MLKKIKDLTDKEINKYLYNAEYESNVLKYNDRKDYSEDEDKPLINITYDNCRYCKFHKYIFCGVKCNNDETVINYDAVRQGIYKNDEIEVEDEHTPSK